MQTINWRVADGVGYVTLDRPESRNALNTPMFEELGAVFREAAADDAVRGLLLTGKGTVFCAGGDLREVGGFDLFDIRDLIYQKARPMLSALMSMEKPVVAALNGPVAGAGIGLALASDMVIAADTADLVMAFGRVGLVPDVAVAWLMVQHIGLLRAKEIVLKARTVPAAEAHGLGLYTRLVPADMLAAEAEAEIRALAAGPTQAIGKAKTLLGEAARLSFDAFMAKEADLQALMHETADHKEGVAAFLEKRPPRYRGK